MLENGGFRIAGPTFTPGIQRGEVQSVTMSLEAGTYYEQAVKRQIQASAGVSVDPTNVLVKASENADVQLRMAATNDTARSAYRVSAKGTPERRYAMSSRLKT
jgi:hypothetical protein